MKGLRFRYFIVLLACLVSNISEARHAKKPIPSAVVVGTVYCDTCFHQEFSQSSHFISGASVAIQCRDTSPRRPAGTFLQVVKTNEHGEFRAHLPLSISKHIKIIKGCSVKLISSSEPFCAVGSTATSSTLHLKSKKEGTHIFSAGFFTFRPLKQPEVCDQKPILHSPKKLTAEKSIVSDYPRFLPPIQEPPKSDLPPAGETNLPGLPKLPPLPSLPRDVPFLPPVPKTLSSPLSMKNVSPNQFPFLPPNPLLPPPSLLPPNPLLPPPSIIPPILPSPPPSLFPPIFPSPPPSFFPPVLPTPSPPSSIFPPIFPFPSPHPPPPSSIFPPKFPIPGSPPPATSAPFLPPFPFQPTPGFPGAPPAVTVSTSATSSSKKRIP